MRQVDAASSDNPAGALPAASIKFFSVFENPNWDNGQEWIQRIIDKYGCREILEIGSGSNPALSAKTVSDYGLRYTTNDISLEELAKADEVFTQWVGDFATECLPDDLRNRFDLILSRMVNEHIKDAKAYHVNVHRALKPGGIAAHFFPTLYCLPFLFNRLIPSWLSSPILSVLLPRDFDKHGKFRAYYGWSRGPSRSMFERFEALGFEVLEFDGYFGHGYYTQVPFLHRLEILKARLLARNPIPTLCSYSSLVLRKR
jgi:SAM-dependent methyltransferase